MRPLACPVARFINTSVSAALTKRKPNLSLRKSKDLEGMPSPSVGTSVQMTSRRRFSTLQSQSTENSTTLSITVRIYSPRALIRVYGRWHIAGFTYDKMLHTLPDEAWDIIQKIHVRAPFRLIRAAAPYMRIKVCVPS